MGGWWGLIPGALSIHTAPLVKSGRTAGIAHEAIVAIPVVVAVHVIVVRGNQVTEKLHKSVVFIGFTGFVFGIAFGQAIGEDFDKSGAGFGVDLAVVGVLIFAVDKLVGPSAEIVSGYLIPSTAAVAVSTKSVRIVGLHIQFLS